VTLRSAIATPAGKGRYVRRLFTTIADRYHFITTALSYGQDRRWKRRLIALAQVRADDTVLDLACGTGDLLFAAAAQARRATGLDLTHRMLQLARRRSPQNLSQPPSPSPPSPIPLPPSPFPLIQGDMCSLPFPGSRFSLVTAGYGLRNVPDLAAAIAEIHRVLLPGGRFLSLDFNRPANRVVRAAYLAYLSVVGSAFGLALHGDADTYRYIPESIRTYPGAAGVAWLLEAQGFTEVRVVPLLGGLMAIHVATKR
jgi:ubiquinone/menaquinone biosynthesis methyltransferase